MLTGTDLLTVERAIQLALTPAFVLGGTVNMLVLLTSRLQRIVDREQEVRDEGHALSGERGILVRRARLVHVAITACILAALLLCIVVVVAFVEPLLGATAGEAVAATLVGSILALTAALLLLLWEVILASRSLPLRPRR
jgi:Protein of unknown function (DUF2721)